MHFVCLAICSQNHTRIQFSLTNIFDAFSPSALSAQVQYTTLSCYRCAPPVLWPATALTALIAPRRTIKLNGGPALGLGPRVAAGLRLGVLLHLGAVAHRSSLGLEAAGFASEVLRGPVSPYIHMYSRCWRL
jgi:hypothetical protein